MLGTLERGASDEQGNTWRWPGILARAGFVQQLLIVSDFENGNANSPPTRDVDNLGKQRPIPAI